MLDEEVLLRIMFPEEHVQALLATASGDEALHARMPLMDLVRHVLGRRRSGVVSIHTDGLAVSARFP